MRRLSRCGGDIPISTKEPSPCAFPEPDSHFKLLDCRNCGGKAGYMADGEMQRVACSYCGRATLKYGCRHEAQVAWNRNYGEGWREFGHDRGKRRS